MKETLITILTPTYNRAYCIDKLYNSLCEQTNSNFNWLIVDDGSSDNTKEIINKFKEDNKVTITYFYKNNGGKHTALNKGIQQINTKYTFIVDSDDYLTKDAIEQINKYDDKYGEMKEISGFSFLRQFPDGKVNGNLFKQDDLIDTYVNVRMCGQDIMADKAEVFFTDVLKQYPFPEFENEKFLGEDVVWVEMSKKYKMVHINKSIYIGEYQSDGLTNNRRKNNIKCPKGCYQRAKVCLSVKLPFKLKLKNIMQLIIYGKFKGNGFKKTYSDYKSIYTILMYIPSLLIYKRWKKAA